MLFCSFCPQGTSGRADVDEAVVCAISVVQVIGFSDLELWTHVGLTLDSLLVWQWREEPDARGADSCEATHRRERKGSADGTVGPRRAFRFSTIATILLRFWF